jgi:two-component system, chemotaxis family, chemotaxis protein CheY
LSKAEYEGKTVALVGHCGPDMFALRSAIRSALPGAQVVSVQDEKMLAATGADLVLVNRVLDGRFEDESGLKLIERLGGAGPAVMLVSNFPDAQAAAEQAGALPGFGKRELYSDAMKQRLRTALTG